MEKYKTVWGGVGVCNVAAITLWFHKGRVKSTSLVLLILLSAGLHVKPIDLLGEAADKCL